jgi:hypothetical protein
MKKRPIRRSVIHDLRSLFFCVPLRPLAPWWCIFSLFPCSDDAYAGVAAKVVFGFGAFPVEGFVDAVLIVDDGEFFDIPSVAKPRGEGTHGKCAVGVEFDTFGSDGCGEVENAAGFDHALQLLESFQVAKRINVVAITSETKVFDAVKA